MAYANEGTKIMKSQLEETKQKIIELLDRYSFPKYGGVNIDPPDKIYVDSGRYDMSERIHMTIRRSGHRWSITMPDDDRPHYSTDEEKMLEFIENTLRELVKCCG